MLIDERLVALNTVIDHCRELAELYAGDRAAVDDDSQSFFAECARSHDQFADELAGEIRRDGELPAESDPERLGVERLVTEVKSFFSTQRETSLVETFAGVESRLDQALSEARAQAKSERIESALVAHQRTVREHLETLKRIGEGQSGRE